MDDEKKAYNPEEDFEDEFENFDMLEEQDQIAPAQSSAKGGAFAGAPKKPLFILAGILLLLGLLYLIMPKSEEEQISLAEPNNKQTIDFAQDTQVQAETGVAVAPEGKTFEDISQAFASADEAEQPAHAQQAQNAQTTEQTNEPDQPPPSPQHKKRLLATLSDLQKELFEGESIEEHKELPEGEVGEEEEMRYIEQSFNRFANKIKQNEAEIQQLENSVTNLAKTLSNLGYNVRNLHDKTKNIASSTTQLTQKYNEMQQIIVQEDLDVKADLPKKKPQTITYTAPEYIVHAIIPGRAWLRKTSGQILSITEGDDLGDYGKVLVIDASNGIVMTSSGLAFR